MAQSSAEQPNLGGVVAEDFDRNTFLSRVCQDRFRTDKKRGIIKEKGINLENVEERLPGFYQRLYASKWICFAQEPIKANHTWVREFYANALHKNSAQEFVTVVRGKRILFDALKINEVYELPDFDEQEFHEKVQAGGTNWLVNKLQNGKVTNWVTFQTKIVSNDFIAEARIWLAIICTRVSPSTNTTDVTKPRPQVIAAILDGINVNVGRLIAEEIKAVVHDNSGSLFFPSLITQLCKNAGVPTRPTDAWKSADGPVFPLKYKGEGSGQKKRKIDTMPQLDVLDPSFGQFHHSTAEQGSSSTAAPGSTLPPPLRDGPRHLQYISSQISIAHNEISTGHNEIKQLISALPTGPTATHTSTTESTEGVTLENIASAQKALDEKVDEMKKSLDEKVDKIKKRQDKFGRRTAIFFNKMMKKVSYLCGATKESAPPTLSYPSTSSDEENDTPQESDTE